MTDAERNSRNRHLVENNLPPEEPSYRGWNYQIPEEEQKAGVTQKFWCPHRYYWVPHGPTAPFGDIRQFVEPS